MAEKHGVILVVDDEPNNLQLIKEILQQDYQLAFAVNGLLALRLAEKIEPDLILMDIMMPEIDGYETCRRLKADPRFHEIPVIFVTTKNENEDEDLAFKVGAVDYLVKPIDPMLLKARIHNHIELKSARDELKKQNSVLQENMQLQETIEAITRHDLKGPLTGIINYPTLVISNGGLSEKQTRLLQNTVKLGHKMLNIINLSLDLYKMEKGTYPFQPAPFDVISTIKEIIEENGTLINKNNLNVEIRVNGNLLDDSDPFFVHGEPLLFYSMLSNVIKNAFEASFENETILIHLDNRESITIQVHNTRVVPIEIRDRFFDKYVTHSKTDGTGLGTYSAHLAAKTQNGQVFMETSEQDGTTITFQFPSYDSTQ